MRYKFLAALVAASLTGCSLLPSGAGTGVQHTSAVLEGYPVSAKSNEDSLNFARGYLFWERPGGLYIEAGVGYRLGDGGFYVRGAPVLFQCTVDKRFRFGK